MAAFQPKKNEVFIPSGLHLCTQLRVQLLLYSERLLLHLSLRYTVSVNLHIRAFVLVCLHSCLFTFSVLVCKRIFVRLLMRKFDFNFSAAWFVRFSRPSWQEVRGSWEEGTQQELERQRQVTTSTYMMGINRNIDDCSGTI